MHMFEPYIDSMLLRFQHITLYHLTERHRMQPRKMEHSVIWLVDDGVLFVQADGQAYQGQSGDMFMIPAGTKLLNQTGMAASRVVSINFDGNVPLYGKGNWFELFGIRFQSQASVEVRDTVGRMLKHSEEVGPARKLFLQSDLLCLVAILITDSASGRYDPFDSIGDIRVKRAVDYILARPERLPEVRELAEIADVSDSHLRKLFQQYTGLSPAQYIHYVKFEQAKRELAGTDRRISEIGAGLGFSEPNYFSRLFKTKTGYTPSEYRHQFRIWGEK